MGTPSGGIGLRDKSKAPEAICEKCDFLITKPGSMPGHLAPLIIQAHRMELLFEAGAGVPYPQVFTPLEWEAFITLVGARAKDQEKDFPKKQERTVESEIQRMQQRIDRG